MSDFLRTVKRVVVTGAAGSVGRHLVAHLLEATQAEVVGLDSNESVLYYLEDRWRSEPRMKFYISDIRQLENLEDHFKGADVVFHGAALKHLPLCERSPFEAVRTNIHGVQNVIRAATAARVSRVLYMSTDKAASPTTVMGTSKLMGERLITAAQASSGDSHSTVFATTRFGNVAGSTGSVIPLFVRQIERRGPVTITDPDMTRFIMTADQAVALMIESINLAHGGEVFVTKMPVVRIIDLARVMIGLLAPLHRYDPKAIDLQHVGPRPGEKLHEDLVTAEEAHRTHELDHLFVIRPALDQTSSGASLSCPTLAQRSLKNEYRSDLYAPMSHAELASFLEQPGVLPDELRERLIQTDAA